MNMTREKKNLSISSKGFILILVPLVFQIGLLLVLTLQLQKAEAEVQNEIRSKAVISQANALSKLFYDVGVAMGGYSITKSPLFADRFEKIKRQIPLDLAELKRVVGENPGQQARIKRLEQITRDGLKILQEAKDAIDDNRVDVSQFRARHMYKQIRTLADNLQDELTLMTADARHFMGLPTVKQYRERAFLKECVFVAVVFNCALALFLVLLILINSIRAVSRIFSSKKETALPGNLTTSPATVSPSVSAPDSVSLATVVSVPEPVISSSRLFAMSRPALGVPRDKIVKLTSARTTGITKKRRHTTKPPAKRAS